MSVRPTSEGVIGSLASLSLAELVQTLSLSARTARVRLFRRGVEGNIWFEGGKLVHAATGEQTGEAAFFEMVRWREGRFSIHDGETTPTATLSEDAMFLVLEGLRRIDEESCETSKPAANAVSRPGGPRIVRRWIAVTGLLALAVTAAVWGWVRMGGAPASDAPAVAWWSPPEIEMLPLLDPSVLKALAQETRAINGTFLIDAEPVETELESIEAGVEAEPVVEAETEPATPPVQDFDPADFIAALLPVNHLGPVGAAQAPPPPSGTLVVDVVSRVEAGRLSLTIDGDPWLERDVAWKASGAKRMFRRMAGSDGDRFRERIELPAGAYELVARLEQEGSREVREIRYVLQIAPGNEQTLRLFAQRKRGGILEIREDD